MTTRARRTLFVLALAALAVPACSARPKGPGAMRVVAGNGTAGFADGTGGAARFHKPIRLAASAPDSVVVADIFNHAIREVSLDGRVRTIVGGPDRKGYRDGPAEEAQIASPHGVAVSPTGTIAVAEAANHTIRLLTPTGSSGGATRYAVSTLAGAAGQEGRRRRGGRAGALPLAARRAVRPRRLARRARHRQRPRPAASARAAWRRWRAPRRARSPTRWTSPSSPDGTLLIADAGAHLVRTWTAAAGLGTLKVAGALHTPHGVAAGPDGTVYVADMNAHQVVAVDREGRLTRVAGTGEKGGGPSQLNKPAAVLVHAGHLWIADLDNHRITVVPLR